MRKICVYILILSLVCVFTSACTRQTGSSNNLIKSERRFEKYMAPRQESNPNAIDLSDGPKLNYDAKFGPQSLNFDIKIVDPY